MDLTLLSDNASASSPSTFIRDFEYNIGIAKK